MGIYAPIIRRAQSTNKAPEFQPSTKVVTVPTTITGTRIPLALKAGERILCGQKYAAPWVAAMAASDMEGIPARFIDKHWPDSGLGSSELGTKADVAADAAAAAVLGTAILFGPNISKTAKTATALVLGREGLKAAWYMGKNKVFRAALREAELPEADLVVPVDLAGKETMVEEFLTLFYAATTNDIENPALRMSASGLAVAHSAAAARRGLRLQSMYDGQANEQIANLNTTQPLRPPLPVEF